MANVVIYFSSKHDNQLFHTSKNFWITAFSERWNRRSLNAVIQKFLEV